MTAKRSPPGSDSRGADVEKPAATSRSTRSTVTPQADESVPLDHPWHGRPDAAETEENYRRSVHYWRRRRACDQHGRRGEHDCDMSASKPRPPKVVQVRALGTNTVEFLGADSAVYGAAKRAGARFMRSPRHNSWLVREDGADDVMALLEHRGWRMDVTL